MTWRRDGAVMSTGHKTIDKLVTDIRTHFLEARGAETKSLKRRLAAGYKLRELQKRIEAGEAGEGINWWEWYATKFNRSRKDAEKLIAMAKSDNPEAAHEKEKTKARERMRKVAVARTSRENKIPQNEDIVASVLLSVKGMDAEQRHRFDVAYMEEYHGK